MADDPSAGGTAPLVIDMLSRPDVSGGERLRRKAPGVAAALDLTRMSMGADTCPTGARRLDAWREPA